MEQTASNHILMQQQSSDKLILFLTIISMALCKIAVSPVHWRYCSLTLSHRYLLESKLCSRTRENLRWWPGSLHCQVINSHGMDSVRLKSNCFICENIPTTHTISVLRNDRKCKHMFPKIIQYVKVYHQWRCSPFPSQTGAEFIQMEIKLLKVIHCSLLWNSRWLSPGWLTGHVINTPHRLRDHPLGFCIAESRFWKSLWKEVRAYPTMMNVG